MKLTDHLLALDKSAYEKATRHEFLDQVGRHTIEPQHLRNWIEQDRGYTNGYTRLMGHLISRISLFSDTRDAGDVDPTYTEAHAQRTMKFLSFATSNVFRECQMFTELLARPAYKALPSHGVAPWTHRYIDFHQKVGRESHCDLGEGLVCVWAMEKVFFDAWNHAKAMEKEHKAAADLTNASHHDTISELISNWTNDEFAEFVDESAALVDHLSTEDPERLKALEKVYLDTLALEIKFWDQAFGQVQV
ncbi:hypothetical protein BC940DRAFT_2130 [Gongronella butleri]|nr:hypothetical protein BC940DRAFT_2130 [Gongronella butleri]